MNIHQYYDTMYPGQVEVVGVEMWTLSGCTANGTRAFRSTTGATYPILLGGDLSTGGNFSTLYGPYDNYIVVNKQGIVRYHAADTWPHTNRYHLNEIRGAVDSLVTPTVGVEPGQGLSALQLSVAPNPFRARTSLSLALPGSESMPGRVTVHDLAGRRVATLHDGAIAPGTTRFKWDGTDTAGAAMRAGVYIVQATVGDRRITRRVALLR